MADGFLGRWSQRKQAVREGKSLSEPPLPLVSPVLPAQSRLTSASGLPAAARDASGTALNKTQPVDQQPSGSAQVQPAEQPPVLSLDDVKVLTPDSDYAPFVSRSVAPEVRNAAMKKLFTDPHYNVMDRLDTYIDDYSLPDPLPESMLRKMASAKFLKLFDDEEKDVKATGLGDVANTPNRDSVAKSTSITSPDPATCADPVSENLPLESGLDHDHTDLRLQPNYAAGPQEPGRSTE